MLFKKPKLEDFHFFRLSNDARNAAVQVTNAMRGLAGAIDLPGAFAIAQSRHPGAGPLEALQALLGEIEAATLAAQAYRVDFDALSESERTRLAPIVSTASRRALAIQGRMGDIASESKSFKSQTEKRREELLLAKVSPEDIDKLTPMFDLTAGEAETALLQVELVALELFLKTSDEAHLPAGFEVVTVLQVEVKAPPLELPSWLKK